MDKFWAVVRDSRFSSTLAGRYLYEFSHKYETEEVARAAAEVRAKSEPGVKFFVVCLVGYAMVETPAIWHPVA